MVGLLECLAHAAGERLELAEILSGAEAAARAGEHDRADLRIGRLASAAASPSCIARLIAL